MSKSPPTEQSIFLIARQIHSQPERQAYLDQICGDDTQLRESVLTLLAADDRSDDVLAVADDITSNLATNSATEAAGARVGPYKLLEKIGEGGMGVVFLAEQAEPVRRRVALKIIKPGMDSRLVIARFEAERQALALMDHQNIARVYDAGQTESGHPYFVMELVRGVPITEFADKNALDLQARLELFQQVCRAIQHSHQKGIIHRDIKPNNVLVCNYDGLPVPKVIDFGVAKATHQQLTEKTLFTQHGQVVGTLEYMSPEQAELSQLDIDIRSDIYSLGVLLYELLTGSTPLTKEKIRSTAFMEVLRVIREEEAEKPSVRLSKTSNGPATTKTNRSDPAGELGNRLRSELDWVIMKALSKDRKRRYETVNAFHDDLARYLANEPVAACPPSLAYRMRKYAVRHRTGLSLAAGSVFLALLFVGFLLWEKANNDRARMDNDRVRMEYETGLAIDMAFRGRLADALSHAAYADKLGANPVWVHMLTGIVKLYEHHGSSESALDDFETALEIEPDNVSIKSLLAIAYVWDGRWAAHEQMLEDIREFDPPTDDIKAHFFLGQALMWSEPERGVSLIQHAHEKWKDCPIVKMMLAEAFGHWAWATGNEDHIDQSLSLAIKARDSIPENKSARALCNWVHMIAVMIRQSNGKPVAKLLDASKVDVEWLNENASDEYLIGFANRAWYYHLLDTQESTDRAIDLWRQAVTEKQAKGWFASCYAAEQYRRGKNDSIKALNDLKDDPRDPDLQLARVHLLMDSDPVSNKNKAISIAESLEGVSESRICKTTQMMMWMRIGDLEQAKRLAQQLASNMAEPNAFQVILGEKNTDELFEHSFGSQRVELDARLLVAFHQMATGRIEKAKETLAPAVKADGRCVVAQPAHWARALYERPFELRE